MTIQQIQYLLSFLGYDTGGTEGIYGPKTTQAVRDFQKEYGFLDVDGEAGESTQEALRQAVRDVWIRPEAVGPESGPAATGTFWDEIEYFTREEFRCPCGRFCNGFPVEPQEALVKEVDLLRETLSVPVIVVPPDGHSGGSGVRCQTYNDSLKGSVSNSRHLAGKAVDCIVPASLAAKVEAHLAQRKAAGKIRYWYKISSGSYHLDVE